ncbi:MAG: hypothetical protein Q7S58_12045 [Candidatus Binatus sp.]|uniref:hypothetical protein n=1 Tax=Candidatus Binatus sp. TaxID=2811406 RepID=UPI00271FBF2D|nr:hypothetical protein [Candidatus Binatus sp.]MDO8433131.1 hypothetical protein [Candidatus Binatus sp.]
MNATINEAGISGIGRIIEATPPSDAVRLAQYNMLNEMPGVIFGVITVAYIVSSLISLVH